MKRYIRKLSTIIPALVLLLAGFVAGTSAKSIGHDSHQPLNNQVRHGLVTLPWLGVFDNLQYQVNGTVVTLSGNVISEHAQTKKDAEKAVRRIEGVAQVMHN